MAAAAAGSASSSSQREQQREQEARRPLRVAFFNPQGNFDRHDTGWTSHPDFGGQLVYVKEVAVALAKLGCAVDIFTRRIEEDATWQNVFAEELDAYAHAPGVRIVRVRCGPTHAFLPKEQLWPYLAQWTENILAFYRRDAHALPDACTGHYGDGGYAAALFADRTGVPFTFTAHSLGAQKLEKFAQREQLESLLPRFAFDKRIAAERYAMARASRIITSTDQEREEQYAHAAYGGAVDMAREREAKFAVIPPGVNTSVFGRDALDKRRGGDNGDGGGGDDHDDGDASEAAETERQVRARIDAVIARDITRDVSRRHLPIVMLSSRLERKKNHIDVVRAFALDAELRAHANLMIAVRGTEDALRDRCRAFHGEALQILDEIDATLTVHNLHHQCVITVELRSQRELAAAYRYLAGHYRGVFCLSAVYEPFGLAPLEAMAAGMPAVVTRHGGPSESLRDRYGVLVDPVDPVDIARGLKRVVMDGAEWRRMQQLGMQRVYTHYTWAATGERYLAVIREVWQRAGGARDCARADIEPPAFVQRTVGDDDDDGDDGDGDGDERAFGAAYLRRLMPGAFP